MKCLLMSYTLSNVIYFVWKYNCTDNLIIAYSMINELFIQVHGHDSIYLRTFIYITGNIQ